MMKIIGESGYKYLGIVVMKVGIVEWINDGNKRYKWIQIPGQRGYG